MYDFNTDFCGYVIGIIDSYGAVHSHKINVWETVSAPMHGDLWPFALKKWRWTAQDGFDDLGGIRKENLTEEDYEAVRNELERLGFNLQ